ncbi:type II toxin-antitoxin system VapC family toxin [Nocardia stercoris]|uniref:type II toxin-antitoxin system VapC family toxin n=1 Tax=Nocardia stercoris TaxID=2483361 RepID=UPI001F43EC53|nr:type II toxin-antitoxin system VapC family toxin [Nocardia stercoris]
MIDASCLVDLLANTDLAAQVRDRIAQTVMHAPAHVDLEVLSALGRLGRAGTLSDEEVEVALGRLARAPIQRHLPVNLIRGAWQRRANIRFADAIYVELSDQLGVPLLTTDFRLARAYPGAEPVGLVTAEDGKRRQ